MTINIKALALLVGTITSSTAIAQETIDPEIAGATAADVAVEAAEQEMEQTLGEQERLDKQLRVCRAALEEGDWVAYVAVAISNDPTLGSRTDHIRTCIAYFAGRRDQLIAERDRLERR